MAGASANEQKFFVPFFKKEILPYFAGVGACMMPIALQY